MRIEISACEMAPDMLVGFLFQLPVRDGVAMLARLHVARQDFLFQLRPPSPPPGPWNKEQQWCINAVEGSRALATQSPVSNRSRATLPGEWVATHPCPGAICVPQSTHRMGWLMFCHALTSFSLEGRHAAHTT